MRADLEQRILIFFSATPSPVAAVYVFGSVARGTAGEDSDIDIGVLFAEPPASTFAAQPYGLEGDLERALGQPVGLVALNTAPVDLRSRVLRDGRLVLERDRSARIAFEVRTRNEAFDLAPILAAIAPRAGPAVDRSRPRRQETGVHRDLRRRSATPGAPRGDRH